MKVGTVFIVFYLKNHIFLINNHCRKLRLVIYIKVDSYNFLLINIKYIFGILNLILINHFIIYFCHSILKIY